MGWPRVVHEDVSLVRDVPGRLVTGDPRGYCRSAPKGQRVNKGSFG